MCVFGIIDKSHLNNSQEFILNLISIKIKQWGILRCPLIHVLIIKSCITNYPNIQSASRGQKSRYGYFRTPKHHLEYTVRIRQNSVSLINASANVTVHPTKRMNIRRVRLCTWPQLPLDTGHWLTIMSHGTCRLDYCPNTHCSILWTADTAQA